MDGITAQLTQMFSVNISFWRIAIPLVAIMGLSLGVFFATHSRKLSTLATVGGFITTAIMGIIPVWMAALTMIIGIASLILLPSSNNNPVLWFGA